MRGPGVNVMGTDERGPVEGGVPVGVLAGRLEADVAQALDDLLQGDAQVHAGQVGAGATMRPGAERDVAVGARSRSNVVGPANSPSSRSADAQ